MFSAIIQDALPDGYQWLDNLDVLNAIRISSISVLNKFYVRLGIANLNDIETFAQKYNDELCGFTLSPEQQEAVRKIHDLYSKDPELHAKIIEAFLNLWDSFETLKQIRIWYNNLRQNISITSIGRALAHANARRLYSSLPELEELA